MGFQRDRKRAPRDSIDRRTGHPKKLSPGVRRAIFLIANQKMSISAASKEVGFTSNQLSRVLGLPQALSFHDACMAGRVAEPLAVVKKAGSRGWDGEICVICACSSIKKTCSDDCRREHERRRHRDIRANRGLEDRQRVIEQGRDRYSRWRRDTFEKGRLALAALRELGIEI